MIKSFKDKELETLWQTGKCKKIRHDLAKRILMKLDSIDAATTIEDLRSPPSNNLHQLHGKYKGFWAISVNGSWRLVFTIQNNDICDIMLLQYH